MPNNHLLASTAVHVEPQQSTAAPETLADDMLNGAAEIAAFTKQTVRQVQHQLENGSLPAFQIGRLWRMRKSTYLRHIEKLEAEALAAA